MGRHHCENHEVDVYQQVKWMHDQSPMRMGRRTAELIRGRLVSKSLTLPMMGCYRVGFNGSGRTDL
jgi:hypothetical protein